jgi:DNA-binding MarR family transcriptional regulator
MVKNIKTRKAKAKSASRPPILQLLTSASEQKVLAAVKSLKTKGSVGIPRQAEIADEIKALGHDVPDHSLISRAMSSLEEKGYIRRELEVLAQEGGAA